MHIWFWAWLLLAGIFAGASLFDRDRYVLPWAIGAGAATLVEALGLPIAWEWIVFILGSTSLLIGIQLFRKPGRKSLQRERKRTAA